jgi:hypothetical protein
MPQPKPKFEYRNRAQVYSALSISRPWSRPLIRRVPSGT